MSDSSQATGIAREQTIVISSAPVVGVQSHSPPSALPSLDAVRLIVMEEEVRQLVDVD
jgi:hypothetical protein